jgi:cell division protein FtsL
MYGVFNIGMVDWQCASCGVAMSMPEDLNDQLKDNHKTFYCVSGHANVYKKKTEVQEVENKLMNEYAKNAQLEAKIKELENRGLVNRIFNKK